MSRELFMNNREVAAKLTIAIANERQAMHVVIKLIRIALDQRSYLDFGYCSAFEWLTKEHKYTNSCAQQRINSALLLRTVPEAENLLKTGAVNMSTLSKVQSILKAQEQISGQKVSQDERKEIVKTIENKTLKETELILLEKFPDTAPTVHREHKRTIDRQTIRYSVNFSTQVEISRFRNWSDLRQSVSSRSGPHHAESTWRTNEPSNLRLLCRAHNFHAADQTFGKEKMDRYRTNT